LIFNALSNLPRLLSREVDGKIKKISQGPKAFLLRDDNQYECEVNGGAVKTEHQARTTWLP